MIGLYNAIDSTPEIDYIFDLVLNTIGIPFTKQVNSTKVESSKIPLIITYGKCVFNGPFTEYLQNGGCIINIPNYRNIRHEKKAIKSKGYGCNIFKPEGVFGYLNDGDNLELPVIFPFFYSKKPSEEKPNLKFTSPEEYKDFNCVDIQFISNGLFIGLGIDIISTIYYILTCQHERVFGKLDQYDRLEESNNLLSKNHRQMTPWVNNYISMIEGLIKFSFEKLGIPLLRTWYWPDNHEFALWLSHDIDEVNKFTLKRITSDALNFQLKNALIGFLKISKHYNKDPYWTFNNILKLEKKYGYTSTFFFGSLTKTMKNKREEKKSYKGLEIAYNIDKNHIQKLIKSIADDGYEVGLHGSFGSYLNEDRLRSEKKLIEQSTNIHCIGIRQHYLRLNQPKTWNAQASSGFEYDSTIGYSTTVGFRSGFCFPYIIYDDVDKCPMKLVELPLIVMDRGITHNDNDAFSAKSKKRLFRLMDEVKAHHGFLSILWHNTSFDETTYPGGMKLYEQVLKWSKKNNAYVATGQKITDWWETRNGIFWIKFSENNDNDKYTWEFKTLKTIRNITFKLNVPLELVNRYRINLEPACKIISEESEKAINLGIISITLETLRGGQKYKLNLAFH